MPLKPFALDPRTEKWNDGSKYNSELPQGMAAEVKKEIQLEIAHVLFVDIIGYSKLSINEQRSVIDELTQIVRSSDQYQIIN